MNQEYPEQIIKVQFEKVLQLNRSDLIFESKEQWWEEQEEIYCSFDYHLPPLEPPSQKVDKAGDEHTPLHFREILPTIPDVITQAKNVSQLSLRVGRVN